MTRSRTWFRVDPRPFLLVWWTPSLVCWLVGVWDNAQVRSLVMGCFFRFEISSLWKSVKIKIPNTYISRANSGSGVKWAYYRSGLSSSSLLYLSLDSSADLWVALRILQSAEEDNVSAFDSKIACLCQSIGINMRRPVPLGFLINKFPLWDDAGRTIKVSQACPTG